MSSEVSRLRRVINVLKAAAELGDFEISQRQSKSEVPPSSGSAMEEFITVREFLKSMGLSYGSYCKLRKAGKTPPELRLSKNTVRISKAEIAQWQARRGSLTSDLA